MDASTVIAGPTIGMLLGDFGADVIKIEHPRGDVLRETGHQKNGVGLWFKMANRNKRCITMNFSTSEGAELLKELIKTTDVLIEKFSDVDNGKMGARLGYIKSYKPGLVMVRVTGFGQTGPYKMRPGFGTIVEAFSGFSNVTGEKKWAANTSKFWTCRWNSRIIWNICDNVCSVLQRWGDGQFIDLSIYEPIFQLLGPQPMAYDQLGIIPERMGNRSLNNAPRNTYIRH